MFSVLSRAWDKEKIFLSQVILMMTSAQVVETSVTTTDNSPSQGYTYPVDQTTLLHVQQLGRERSGYETSPLSSSHYKGSQDEYRPERLCVSTKFLICSRSYSSPSLAIQRGWVVSRSLDFFYPLFRWDFLSTDVPFCLGTLASSSARRATPHCLVFFFSLNALQGSTLKDSRPAWLPSLTCSPLPTTLEKSGCGSADFSGLKTPC